MITPPDVIYILDQPYVVKLAEPEDAFPRGASAEAVGALDTLRQAIYYRGLTDTSESQIIDTIVHEVLHAIISLYGLGPYFVNPQDSDEALVAALTPALIHTLRDNPALMQFLTQNLG